MPGAITITNLYDSSGEVTISNGKAAVLAGYIRVIGQDNPEVRGMMGEISGDTTSPNTVDSAYGGNPNRFAITWSNYQTLGEGQTLSAYDPHNEANYDEIDLTVE